MSSANQGPGSRILPLLRYSFDTYLALAILFEQLLGVLAH